MFVDFWKEESINNLKIWNYESKGFIKMDL